MFPSALNLATPLDDSNPPPNSEVLIHPNTESNFIQSPGGICSLLKFVRVREKNAKALSVDGPFITSGMFLSFAPTQFRFASETVNPETVELVKYVFVPAPLFIVIAFAVPPDDSIVIAPALVVNVIPVPGMILFVSAPVFPRFVNVTLAG
jgi:hypothetical protein